LRTGLFDGTLGLALLRGRVVTVDYPAGRITLSVN